MCVSNITNGQLDFENKTKTCYSCKEGNLYDCYTKCTVCKGKGTNLKNGRNYRCKATGCNSGSVMLDVPVFAGICQRCNGTMLVPAERFDNINAVDKELLFELFNFDKPYVAGTSAFNEQYLGIGIVAGVTDYGRYLNMTPDEFKAEVKKNFTTGFLQYVSISKDGKLPNEILVSKKRSGWFAYPVY